MATLDFPASPSNGQQFTGPGGVIWVYDGAKWVSGTLTTGIYAPINSVPNLNYADNTGFAINQRTYVSGTALAAGAFGHDRWKGGAGGGTYTFAAPAGPANTITITAGTLQQVIEGLAIAGGNYMLSWTGTAQGRVGAGSYAASPVAVTSITAGANTTIEFNTGTLSRVKFEAGTVVTPWQALAPADDLQRCQRFACQLDMGMQPGVVTAGSGYQISFPVPMRGTPTPTNQSAGSVASATFISEAAMSNSCAFFQLSTSAVAGYIQHRVTLYSADL